MDTNRTNTAESQPQQPFDIDAALKDARFNEFLAAYTEKKFPDGNFDVSDDNAPEIQAMYETYKSKNEIVRGMRQIFSQELGKDLGLKLAEEDLKEIDSFVEKAVMEDPAEGKKWLDGMQAYQRFPAEIKQAEDELAKRGFMGKEATASKIAELKKEVSDITKDGWSKRDEVYKASGKWLPFLHGYGRKMKVFEQAVAELEGKKGELAKHEIDASMGEKLERMKSGYRQMRQSIFEGTELSRVMAEKAQQKLAEHLNIHREGRTVSDLEATMEMLNRLEQSGTDTAAGLTGLTETIDIARAREEVDEAVDNLVRAGMVEAINKLPMAGLEIGKMERALRQYLKQQEKIGSRRGAEAKEAILNMIEDIIKEENIPHVKKNLLKRLHIQLKK